MPATPLDIENMLIGLAWFGELNKSQIKRLWFPDRSNSSVDKVLNELRRDEVIEKRSWSKRDEERQVTVPQLARWSLTPAGHAQVKSSPQYPTKATRPRQKRLIGHDDRTIETIVLFIERARLADLSGIALYFELRLNPKTTRPIMDALIVMQLHGGFQQSNLVPWSNDLPLEDESLQRFAIEGDGATEPAEVIRGKARAYKSVTSDPEWRDWWYDQYGPMPLVVWTAPTAERAEWIHEQWLKVWPKGSWLVGCDAWMQENRWQYYSHGELKRIRVNFAAPPPKLPAPVVEPPALPTPAPALPALTTQATPVVAKPPAIKTPQSEVEAWVRTVPAYRPPPAPVQKPAPSPLPPLTRPDPVVVPKVLAPKPKVIVTGPRWYDKVLDGIGVLLFILLHIVILGSPFVAVLYGVWPTWQEDSMRLIRHVAGG